MSARYDVLAHVGRMAGDLPGLAELDIDPLLADADGVVAPDARMRLAPASARRCGRPRPSRRPVGAKRALFAE